MIALTKQKLRIVVRVEHDQDTESPLENDCFKMISAFQGGERFLNTFDEFMRDANRMPGEDFWALSCYRHSGEAWSLLGEGHQCQWDTTREAGVLYLENPKERDQWKDVKVDGEQFTSTDAARAVLETYNRWLSGDCWWYRIEVEEETNAEGCCSKCGTPDVNWYERSLEEADSCGGFIGLEHCLDEIESSLKHVADGVTDKSRYEFEICGDEAGQAYLGDISERIKKAWRTSRGEV
jgi:hypothetical protein